MLRIIAALSALIPLAACAGGEQFDQAEFNAEYGSLLYGQQYQPPYQQPDTALISMSDHDLKCLEMTTRKAQTRQQRVANFQYIQQYGGGEMDFIQQDILGLDEGSIDWHLRQEKCDAPS
jgi:hypothetical protein